MELHQANVILKTIVNQNLKLNNPIEFISRQLTTVHSHNRRQEGRVVLSLVSESESQTAYLHGFTELKRLQPAEFSQFNHIISDFKHSPCLAYEQLEGHPIKYWTGCSWHFERNMFKQFASKDNDQYKYIMAMQQETDEEKFKWKLNNFPTMFEDPWFLQNYGENGKIASPKNWGRCYNLYGPQTSMTAEGMMHI